MRWMEMIRQEHRRGREKTEKLLADSAHAAIKEPGLEEARVYTNASFYSDLALNLLWDTDMIHRQGSRVG